MSEHVVTHEPRKLGLLGKALVALMVVLTGGLGIGTGVAVRQQRMQRDETKTRLSKLALGLRLSDYPRPRSSSGTGQERLRAVRYSTFMTRPTAVLESFESGATALDAWGNPIYYRCPGPTHKNGWDLISCGPNGVFEEGGGDDIVVGEDLPGEITAIESGR